VLRSHGVTVERVRAQVERIVGAGDEPSPGQIPFTPQAKQVLETALDEALSLDHDYIATEHILLGLLRDDDGVAARILLDCDVDLMHFRDEVIVRTGSPRPETDEPTSSGVFPAIDPGWLDGLPVLLKPLGEEIRADLGRAPDLGDLLLALICVPHTPAAEVLNELGLDVDELWGRIERARTRAQIDSQASARLLGEIRVAKELAIEEERLDEAAELRDQEREWTVQARSIQRARMATMAELRRRFGISPPPAER
jgi:ATP-dependent Clp protease ATP-binding subunit ClpA